MLGFLVLGTIPLHLPTKKGALYDHGMTQFGNAKHPSNSNFLTGKWRGTGVRHVIRDFIMG
jgi:hypothetical protein